MVLFAATVAFGIGFQFINKPVFLIIGFAVKSAFEIVLYLILKLELAEIEIFVIE